MSDNSLNTRIAELESDVRQLQRLLLRVSDRLETHEKILDRITRIMASERGVDVGILDAPTTEATR